MSSMKSEWETEWFICKCNIEMHSQNELLSGRPSTFDFFVVFIWPVLTSPFLGEKNRKTQWELSPSAPHLCVKLIKKCLFRLLSRSFCGACFPLIFIEFNGFLMSLKRGFWRHFRKVQFHYRLILFAFQERGRQAHNKRRFKKGRVQPTEFGKIIKNWYYRLFDLMHK